MEPGNLDINALHKNQKVRLPGALMIQKACDDKSFKVSLYATPDIMKKLRDQFGTGFVEPKHVPAGYMRGMVHVEIVSAHVVKNT